MVEAKLNLQINVWNTPVNDLLDVEKVAAYFKTGINRVNYKKGTSIDLNIFQDQLIFIEKGIIKVGSTENKKEVTKYLFVKDELLGIAPEFSKQQGDQLINCLDNCTCQLIDRQTFNDFILDESEWKMKIFNIILHQTKELTERIKSNIYKDSRSRIIECLLKMNDTQGSRIGFEYVVRDFVKHQDIANMTATSRQTVTTVLNELRDKDIIKFDRKRLLIRDLEKLQMEL